MAHKPKGPWRRDQVILHRLTEVERRHLAGEANTYIALALGVTEATIRNDIKRLNELWLERIGDDQQTLRSRAIQELDDIKRRALRAAEFDEAAERSVLLDEPLDGAVVYRDAKGSASFRGQKAQSLNVARQAVMDAAKLLGIVVDKVSPTDSEGKTLDLATLVSLARQGSDAQDQPDDDEGRAGSDGED